jgi:hypothetical protein
LAVVPNQKAGGPLTLFFSFFFDRICLQPKITLSGDVHVPKNQPFSSQKGGQRTTTLQLLREFLDRISGGEEGAILAAYLQSRAGAHVKASLTPIMEASRLSKIVEAIRAQHEKAKPHEKAQWLSLVSTLSRW